MRSALPAYLIVAAAWASCALAVDAVAERSQAPGHGQPLAAPRSTGFQPVCLS